MKNMAVVLALLVSAIPNATLLASPPSFTTLQKQMLVKAYRIGGYTLAAIIYQETSACALVRKNSDPLGHGCGSLHLDTAESMVGSKVSAAFLDSDWDFSIRVAYLYLERCMQLFGHRAGITCYNIGIPKARALTHHQLLHSDYLATIKARERELKNVPLSTD